MTVGVINGILVLGPDVANIAQSDGSVTLMVAESPFSRHDPNAAFKMFCGNNDGALIAPVGEPEPDQQNGTVIFVEDPGEGAIGC
jgi:hypothetical protein